MSGKQEACCFFFHAAYSVESALQISEPHHEVMTTNAQERRRK